jgi:hypothetical protein
VRFGSRLTHVSLLRLPDPADVWPGNAATAAPPPPQERHQLRMKPESAQCIIQRHGAFVQAWLKTLPGTETEKKLVRPNPTSLPAFRSGLPPIGLAGTWLASAMGWWRNCFVNG